MNESWTTYRISELISPVKNQERVEAEKTYKLLGLRLEGRGLFVREQKLGIEISSSSLNKVQAGDFIYSRLFAWKGAFDYVRDEFSECYVSGEFPTFSVNHSIIDVKFLYYYFRREKIWAEVERHCIGVTKASRNRFKEKFFLTMEICIPPLQEQKRIVEFISSVEHKIHRAYDLFDEQKQATKNMLYSLYIDMVVDAPTEPLKLVAPLIRRKVNVVLEDQYPELGIRSFGKGTFHKPSLSGVEVGTKKLFRIKQGDLLFSNVFAWEGAIAVAKDIDDNRFGSHRFITCDCDLEKVLPDFLCFHFLTPKGLEEINRCSPGGAGRNKTLGLKKLESILIPLPSVERQKKFVTMFHRFQQLSEHRSKQRGELDQLVPSLLDKTFGL